MGAEQEVPSWIWMLQEFGNRPGPRRQLLSTPVSLKLGTAWGGQLRVGGT